MPLTNAARIDRMKAEEEKTARQAIADHALDPDRPEPASAGVPQVAPQASQSSRAGREDAASRPVRERNLDLIEVTTIPPEQPETVDSE